MIRFAVIAFSFFLPVFAFAQGYTTSSAALVVLKNLQNQTESVSGVQAQASGDETSVQIRLQDPQGKVIDAHFDCHGDHCHDGRTSRADLGKQNLHFKVDALITSLAQTLDIFARKIGPVDRIQNLKIWQKDTEIYVTLSQVGSDAYFMCHVHGGDHFDCHRGRQSGPNAPVF